VILPTSTCSLHITLLLPCSTPMFTLPLSLAAPPVSFTPIAPILLSVWSPVNTGHSGCSRAVPYIYSVGQYIYLLLCQPGCHPYNRSFHLSNFIARRQLRTYPSLPRLSYGACQGRAHGYTTFSPTYLQASRRSRKADCRISNYQQPGPLLRSIQLHLGV